ncbi:hypothetical protein KIL84_011254 [Mauremys mutica]|uniref:Uncharacterized protein n=1 Tax=Mauremys mutica TaxID=74926 RepID=A0A9D4AV69_9SAUR|nr:hypothetical protein KIL84_011254 [Mauremys mutica]
MLHLKRKSREQTKWSYKAAFSPHCAKSWIPCRVPNSIIAAWTETQLPRSILLMKYRSSFFKSSFVSRNNRLQTPGDVISLTHFKCLCAGLLFPPSHPPVMNHD